MNIGILGIPLSGKTTIFNLLTSQQKQTDAYLSAKTKNIGMVKVIDQRLDYLYSLEPSKKLTYATMEVIDIPGIDTDLPEKTKQEIFSDIRNSDAILMVIRVFEDQSIPGNVDPVVQLENLVYEIILRDLEIVENRIDRLIHAKRKLTILEENEQRTLEKCKEHLSSDSLLISMFFNEEELKQISGFSFFSLKPIVVAVNLDENQLQKNEFPHQDKYNRFVEAHKMVSIPICGKMEMEINELPPEERQVFLEDLGFKESGITRLIQTIYSHLGLISFFTIGKDEIRAWTLRQGTVAVKAAGKVHSDMERGFIRAEIVNFNDLKQWGSMQKVKEKGLFKVEGKEYLMKDGDIVNFRFNV